ncbi:MAG: alpha/beta fold hydrolase [Desulfobacteraceae bacterium]|nr:alpha/beta fold hydrolase [Desulfobacteraceae bacterium]
MNLFAFKTTGFAIKTLSNLSRARIDIQCAENIPDGPNIFVINHFTRIETFLLPYHIFKLTQIPVWSLAAAELFTGAFGSYLERVGAVSLKNPDRDKLIVKTLLTGEASWIIFPEGRMVKNKKIVEKGKFMISYAGGKRPPHTGAASLGIRSEFYRQRLKTLSDTDPEMVAQLASQFGIRDLGSVSDNAIHIVPVNLTYYPLRTKENILAKIASWMVEDLPERLVEEIMTEGEMLLSGVDIHIRFGEPIPMGPCLDADSIQRDIQYHGRYNLQDKLPSAGRMRKASLKIMQRYMRDIYSMTTVNYDHIFASLLKYSPVNQIDREALKRRAFLAITRKRKLKGVNFHPDLYEDQLPLLTDENFSKFEDFVGLAEDKGVISVNGDKLIRDKSLLSGVFDFHRARIDNPVAVIANEVEPMKKLLRRISRLSLQPQFWIKRKIVRQLKQDALAEFSTDYDHFFVQGETKPRRIGQPRLIRGRSRKLGILLSHGYMAAPMEVLTLAGYLGRLGYWVYIPRLRGHGTSPEDLASRSYLDWMTSMEKGYALMRNLCRKIVVGGFSTGAALALKLAADIKDIQGVFAISTPIRLQYLSSRFAPAVDVWNQLMDKVRLEDGKMEFVENKPENPHINYHRNPVAGIRELERLMDRLEEKLPDVKIPALVVQSQQDPVVDPRGSERLFKKLGSEDKKYVVFNYQRHGILLGDGAEQVYRTIGQFVQSL